MRLLSLSEVSIQKRTSPDKFTGKLGIRDVEISFAISQVLAFELRGQQKGSPECCWAHARVPEHLQDDVLGGQRGVLEDLCGQFGHSGILRKYSELPS